MNLREFVRKTVRAELKEENSISDYSNLVRVLMNNLEAKYNVELFISYSKPINTIILSQIVVPKEARNEGTGSKVMDEICKFADKHKLKIALTPSSDYGGFKAKLIQFYKRFDFKKYKGFEHKETMERDPQ